uniref:Uncharacterized protein n=1 Tax=Salmonella enterica subsp. salamae TaxID=59202 RepID=I3W440_SALER|nr:hypothetical protein [Salmonella enterica subsp. salamae]
MSECCADKKRLSLDSSGLRNMTDRRNTDVTKFLIIQAYSQRFDAGVNW